MWIFLSAYIYWKCMCVVCEGGEEEKELIKIELLYNVTTFVRQAFHVEFFPLGKWTFEQLRKVPSRAGHLGCTSWLFGSNADIANDGRFWWRDKPQEKAKSWRETQADSIALEGRISHGRLRRWSFTTINYAWLNRFLFHLFVQFWFHQLLWKLKTDKSRKLYWIVNSGIFKNQIIIYVGYMN